MLPAPQGNPRTQALEVLPPCNPPGLDPSVPEPGQWLFHSALPRAHPGHPAFPASQHGLALTPAVGELSPRLSQRGGAGAAQ